MRQNYGVCLSVLLVLTGLPGCDTLIYQSVSDGQATDIKWDGEAVAVDPRYQWPLTRDRFIVTKPPPLAYLTSFSQRFDLEERFDAPLVPWDDLALEEPAEKFLAEVYDPMPDALESLTTIPESEFIGDLSFDLAADGKRLVLLSGRRLTLYNADSGKRIGSRDLPGDWTSDPYAIRFAGKSSDLLVASNEQICRVSGSSGNIIGRTAGPAETILKWQINSGDDTMVLLSESGKLFCGDPQLKRFEESRFSTRRLHDIGLSDDGKTLIVACDEPRPMRYVIERGRVVQDDTLRPHTFDTQARVAAGWFSHGWIDDAYLYLLSKKPNNDGDLVSFQDSLYFYWRPHLIEAYTQMEGYNSFLVVGRRLNGDALDWVLFDVGPQSHNFSFPVVLPEKPSRLLVSEDGRTVAIRDSRGLNLSKRTAWRTSSRLFLWDLGYAVVNQSAMEQIEMLYEALGRQTRIEGGFCPSELQTIILSCVAYRWNYLEGRGENATEAERETLTKITNWHAGGGVLPRSVNGYRNHRKAWDARGTGFSGTVTADGWQTFQAKNELAREELAAVVKQTDKPPALAIDILIHAKLDLEGDLGAIDTLARRFIELYPADTEVADTIGVKLLPQWGGEPGDLVSFLSAHASLYQGRYGDMVYAELVGGVGHLLSANAPDWRNLDSQRLVRGVQSVGELGWPVTKAHWYCKEHIRRLEQASGAEKVYRVLMKNVGVIPKSTRTSYWATQDIAHTPAKLFEDAVNEVDAGR